MKENTASSDVDTDGQSAGIQGTSVVLGSP